MAKAFVGSSPTPRICLQPTKFLEFTEWLQEKKHCAPVTIESKVKILKRLNRHVNLWNAEAVDRFILKANWTNGYKNNVINAYVDWCRFKGFEYTPRKFKKEDRLPYIPSEREIDQLIAGCGPKLACFLQLLKESAFRPIEASRLTPEDFDLSKQICYLNEPAKGSNPRMFKMSNKLTSILGTFIAKTPRNRKIWSGKLDHLRRNFELARRSISNKLRNHNLLKISFRTFRHWKATTEYQQTKDILHVKRMLGHKRIENTLIYTHLLDFDKEDNYVVKVASSLDEFTSLLEGGFEYVSDYNGLKVLRKRK